MDEATATPLIQQFLFNRRSSEAIAREMKQIRDRAQIVYAGEFAVDADAAETKPRQRPRQPPPSNRWLGTLKKACMAFGEDGLH